MEEDVLKRPCVVAVVAVVDGGDYHYGGYVRHDADAYDVFVEPAVAVAVVVVVVVVAVETKVVLRNGRFDVVAAADVADAVGWSDVLVLVLVLNPLSIQCQRCLTSQNVKRLSC